MEMISTKHTNLSHVKTVVIVLSAYLNNESCNRLVVRLKKTNYNVS
jgi:hypothetical protein